jgi:threonine synthase
VAVNSINWARIMAQIVYYAYAALALGAPSRPVAFSVPTGNFGDIFAGYLASRMGLPVAGLMIATNRNDVLHRLLSSGSYARGELHPTLSPSMDISVSSNLERLLFDLYDRDGASIARLMEDFTAGPITLVDAALAEARRLFSSFRVDDEATVSCIARIHRDCEYLLDPHSAIGVAAAEYFVLPADVPRVTLATAHPAKFPAAVAAAVPGLVPQLPPHMADLYQREERYAVVDAELNAVQSAMAAALER